MYFYRQHGMPATQSPQTYFNIPFVPPAPAPSTVGFFPGLSHLIPAQLMQTYGQHPGTTMQVYGQPYLPQVQSLPHYPPYYQTPPTMVTPQYDLMQILGLKTPMPWSY
jgi:hypothetical protein